MRSSFALLGLGLATACSIATADNTTSSANGRLTKPEVCETTAGVNQYSGFVSVGANMSLWYRFFESRNDPANSPLAIYLAGGPGCSSVATIPLEGGPCLPAGPGRTKLNPHSWNTIANLLYIDQPIGSGFSYGDPVGNSTVRAAPHVWQCLQTFLNDFPQYKGREVGILTSSYGGHWGPAVAQYFLEQNSAIDTGISRGNKINLVALSIANGWIDPARQYGSHAPFAYDNPYRRLIDNETLSKLRRFHERSCLPALAKCPSAVGSNDACLKAEMVCQGVRGSAGLGQEHGFDVYDVRQDRANTSSTREGKNHTASWEETNSEQPADMRGYSPFESCSMSVFRAFAGTGDIVRSFLPQLSSVVEANITTLIWAGDADFLCNWKGNLAAADAIVWTGRENFASARQENYTVDGVVRGSFKSVGNLSWLRAFNASHSATRDQPELSLQAFAQIIKRGPLSST